jgi:hypothetical protein
MHSSLDEHLCEINYTSGYLCTIALILFIHVRFFDRHSTIGSMEFRAAIYLSL